MRLALVLAVLLFVSGCVSLPACPTANASIVQMGGGTYFIFDVPNMEILAGRMRQIQERSCDPDVEAAPKPAPAPVPAQPAAVPEPGWPAVAPERTWDA